MSKTTRQTLVAQRDAAKKQYDKHPFTIDRDIWLAAVKRLKEFDKKEAKMAKRDLF